MLNGHRELNMYKMTTDVGHMLEYDGMFLRYNDKYALKEGYHYYNGNFLIRPLVTHFIECHLSTSIGLI